MLRASSLSRNQLGESAAQVEAFLRDQLTPQGGFRDRDGTADLYYSVFGLESLLALGAAPPQSCGEYLKSFGTGDSLDLVHLCCLIRCRASASLTSSGAETQAFKVRLEQYRSLDGGYHTEPSAPHGSAYGCFLVSMAYEDLGEPIPAKQRLLEALAMVRASDGGYANQPGQPFGLTPSTAAAATLLRSLDETPPPGLESWLLSRRHPIGGFLAVPFAPIPDLLSTATALHALNCLGTPLADLREPCLDFINSLWTGNSFAGSWADATPDCEYTYYGLLALGSLSQ